MNQWFLGLTNGFQLAFTLILTVSFAHWLLVKPWRLGVLLLLIAAILRN